MYQASIGKDLVGAAIIFQDETKKSVYIGRIFIDSIYHRMGYGIRLMECIENFFSRANEFNLDTPCWNERTNAFYKKLGYCIIKIEDGFVFYQKRRGMGDYIDGADKLYISGHSSKESQAAYQALGCKHAEELNEILAEKEPFDVQLEYIL